MGTRSIDELKEAFRYARNRSDHRVLTELAEELDAFGTSEAQALAVRSRASAETVHGNYPAAFDLLNDALAKFEVLRDDVNVAAITGELGTLYWQVGEFANALEYMHKGLALHELSGNREGVAAVTNNLGIIFADTDDYAKALEYYHRALELHAEVGNRFYQANTLGNIGIVYGAIGDHKAALEYQHKAYALHLEVGNRGGEANTMSGIAATLAALEEHDQALEWYHRSIAVAREMGGSRQEITAVVGLAGLLNKLDRLDEALDLLDNNQDLLEQHVVIRTNANTTRGHILWKRGDLESAERLFTECLAQVEARNERAAMADLHRQLRDLAKARGMLNEYVEHNEKYQSITDEISGSASTRRITVQEKEREIEAERITREREREILYGALPQHVAERLIRGENVTDHYDSASVMFLDLAGFTRIASTIPAGHVVHLLDSIFSVCDDICARHGVTKVKTIGDSYMAVAGVPDAQADHVERITKAATEIQREFAVLRIKMPPELGDTSWVKEIGEIHARVGIHCGPVVAGVVGKGRLQYDVWGDAVNVASRMESSGEPGKVQASSDLVQSLQPGDWKIEARVAFEIKGKGVMQTYWVDALA